MVKLPRILAFSAKEDKYYREINNEESNTLLYGPETRGLSEKIRVTCPRDQILPLPMSPGSLSLTDTTVAFVYKTWSQNGLRMMVKGRLEIKSGPEFVVGKVVLNLFSAIFADR